MTDTSGIAGATPAIKGSVFLSYARLDDIKPPFDNTAQGWVKFFWENLRWELDQRGMRETALWLDRYQIEPAEDFTEKIEAALKEARMIITILSPKWVTRDWCLREVNRFVALHTVDGFAKDGLIPVRKIDLPEADIPVVLRNREGYTFYAKDATGAVREFYWRGLNDKVAYDELIKRIAIWIAARFAQSPPLGGPVASPPPPGGAAPASAATIPAGAIVPTGQVVYLAMATDELRDARQRVANDLKGAGYVVYPSSELPDTAAKAEKTVRDALAKAALSVHFLGDSEGVKPDGSNEGIVRLQLRLAREFTGPTGPLPRVLWVPKWLPDNQDVKRDPFEVLKRYGTLQTGEEVFAEEATDLSQMLRARLVPFAPGARAVSRLLIAAGTPEDDDLVGTFANRLQSDEIKVKPRFSGDTEPLDNLDQMTAVLLLWGNASKDSLNGLLDAFVTKHGHITVLCLAGGDVTAKRRFFRDGIYVEQIPEIPADRKSARELLVRLEIVPPASTPNAKQLL